ncbi:pathogenesis-related protein PRB1-3-like [Zingiber officinale]|uniref:SCP domain-containing protein n=1 Tax=Zingiber officinale TaxID=94328 RepID=A0A8J5L9L5_ZINOF|nr:pathogenesis-related protein PRB1-3-like [Zingiber officinale]KAG6505571.1 hypothetical protein ZIOFF_037934 [Zingiber officinale]
MEQSPSPSRLSFLLLLLLLPLSFAVEVPSPPSSGKGNAPVNGGRVCENFTVPLVGGISVCITPKSRPPPPTLSSYFERRSVREFLLAHNRVRGALREKPLQWDRNLARFARRWANQRRRNCDMVHSMGPYGENLFWGGAGADWTAVQAVEEWAKEAEDYDRDSNECAPGKMCGHFTQLVWNETDKVGCALVNCIKGGVIITCNYDPPGNYVGESPFQ